jgi:hypothetical protein
LGLQVARQARAVEMVDLLRVRVLKTMQVRQSK